MNNVETLQTNPSWVMAWDRIFSQATTTSEMQRLGTVKQAAELQEIKLTVEELGTLSKQKLLALSDKIVKSRRPQLVASVLATAEHNHFLIQTREALDYFLKHLAQETFIILNTHIDGAYEFGKSEITGFSFGLPKANRYAYLPTTEESLPLTEILNQLKPYLEKKELKKVLFESKPTLHMLRKQHIKMKGLVMDLQIAAHLLNENEESYDFYHLVRRYGSFFDCKVTTVFSESDLIGRTAWSQHSLDLLTVIACRKASLMYQYYGFVVRQFKRFPRLKKLYMEIENPLIEVCVEMEATGLLIDMAFAKTLEQKLEAELSDLTSQLKASLGDINFNSDTQLKTVFYDKLKLPDYSKGAKKVDKDTLKKLIPHHVAIQPLLKYREVYKLLSTYVKSLPLKVNEHHRLHGTFDQCGATTGRFSSKNPNLQNFPVAARQMVIPATGKIIVGIDYSQVEPRFLAHLIEDESFMQAYIDGRDLYSEIASKTFNLPLSQCGDKSPYRKMVKTGMLATMYGTSSHTLGEQLGVTKADAEKFINDLYTSFPKMQTWMDSVKQAVDAQGYVETAWGRKRRFLGHVKNAEERYALKTQISNQLQKENFSIWQEPSIEYSVRKRYADLEKSYASVKRQSVNSVIQGSAADLMKIALIKLHQFLESKGPEWRLLAAIHDEVLFEIPATATREEIEALAAVQRDAVQLRVPMKVDVEIYQRWGCKMSLDEWMAKKESPLSLTNLM